MAYMSRRSSMRPKQLAILFVSLATLLTCLIVAQGAEASDDYEPLLLKARTLLPENIPPLREQAKAGNSEAQLLIGLACAYGYGTDRDATAAVDWYRKAAEGGNAAAANFLGIAYEDGVGVKKDL